MSSLCRLRGPKITIWGKFCHFLGAPVRPRYWWGQNLVCYSRPTAYAYVPNFVSIGLFCPLWQRKTPIFVIFGLRHLVMTPVGSSLRKLNTGAQLQTFPYPTVAKPFLYSNAFMAKLGAQTLTFKSVRDRQTDKKTNVFGEPHQTLHGDRGPRASSCTSKTFGVWRTVSPLGGAENLGVTRPHQLKTPMTPVTP